MSEISAASGIDAKRKLAPGRQPYDVWSGYESTTGDLVYLMRSRQSSEVHP